MASELRIAEHPVLGPAPETTRATIIFDGVKLEAILGEPVAVALLANGIRGFRAMPESNELRGVLTGNGRSIEEFGSVNGEANTPLMATPVEAGMVVETQQGLGSWETRS